MAHGLEPSAEEGVPPPNKTLVRSESADHKRSRMLSYIKEQRDASAAEGDAPNIMLISGELVKASQDVQGSEDDNSSASGSQSGSDSGSSWGGSSMDSGMAGSNDSQGSRRSTGARQKRAAKRTEKAIKRAEDEAAQRRYLQRWSAPPLIHQAVNDRHQLARKHEPTITCLLWRIVRGNKARLKGLDQRVKTKASLTRKACEKTDGGAQLHQDEIEMVVAEQHDVLRYTAVIPTKYYVKTVNEVIAKLEAAGYGTLKCKNYWVKAGVATDYMGINAVFRTPPPSASPSDLPEFCFECQFHTMQSLDTKMQRCHHSYQRFRESRSLVRAQYWEEMVRMWALVPIPKGGVHEIGEPVVHEMKLDYALAALKPAERAEITKLKALEDVVRPLCEDAVETCMLAEKKVTPTMRRLALEHSCTLHGLDFRIKSALSMARKAVSKLSAAGKTATEHPIDVEAEVWCEQRQALRYTVVISDPMAYAATVRTLLSRLEGEEFGFDTEFCYNYWLDAEPYNAIRTRLWSSELQSWCFIVFHTSESLEYSEARLAYHQQAMGIVFHTATFDEGKTAEAIQQLRNDSSWVAKIKQMTIPVDVATVGQLLHSPTTLATQTAAQHVTNKEEGGEEESEEEGRDEVQDGVTMPHADKGCWHHKVCFKPVDTDEEGIDELPADIRLPASEARRAEEAGHIDRACELYSLAVVRMMAFLQAEVPAATEDEWLQQPGDREHHLSLLAQSFSLANPRLPGIPLIYASSGFTALTGFTRQEAVGQSARFLQGDLAETGRCDENDAAMVAKMREACSNMTDTHVRLRNQRKDGSVFLNQSSLFTVFATESACAQERHNSALLMCVHADATGLTEAECQKRNADAEELKNIIQACLSQSSRTDHRSLAEIRSSEVRPPAMPSQLFQAYLRKEAVGQSAWLLRKFEKKAATLKEQEQLTVGIRALKDGEVKSIARRNRRNLERMLASVHEGDGEAEDLEEEEDDSDDEDDDEDDAVVALTGVAPMAVGARALTAEVVHDAVALLAHLGVNEPNAAVSAIAVGAMGGRGAVEDAIQLLDELGVEDP